MEAYSDRPGADVWTPRTACRVFGGTPSPRRTMPVIISMYARDPTPSMVLNGLDHRADNPYAYIHRSKVVSSRLQAVRQIGRNLEYQAVVGF
jgi:hypothetical protein